MMGLFLFSFISKITMLANWSFLVISNYSIHNFMGFKNKSQSISDLWLPCEEILKIGWFLSVRHALEKIQLKVGHSVCASNSQNRQFWCLFACILTFCVVKRQQPLTFLDNKHCIGNIQQPRWNMSRNLESFSRL